MKKRKPQNKDDSLTRHLVTEALVKAVDQCERKFKVSIRFNIDHITPK